jgi:hypothetical protein
VKRTRYDADQVVEAVGRARGEGRLFLVVALTQWPDPAEREHALAQVLDKELRPDERHLALAELARRNPQDYLGIFVDTGLRSRSIGVQQMTVAGLPPLVGDGLDTELTERLKGWLRHRLANPRRENTWAGWEVPGVALALLPSIGFEDVVGLLDEVEPRMQPEERQRWRELERIRSREDSFVAELEAWWREGGPGAAPLPNPPDPTADLYVDRVMKRLGHRPANPESTVYDSLADFDVPMYVIDLETGRNDLQTRRGDD